MSSSLKKVLLKEIIKPRGYQQVVFANSVNKNSLIVIPTGLGKTLIALMLAIYRFNKDNKKILFLAPTKPLVEQQIIAFKDFIKNYKDFNFVLLTGSVKPEKRADLYLKGDFIFSTPQLIENDIVNKRILPENFSLIILDEAHRASGNYAYCFIAEVFSKRSQIIGLTASPGSSKEEIQSVISNLFIAHIEVKKVSDTDIKEYVNTVSIKKVFVDLSEEFKRVLLLLKKVYEKRVILLKEKGFFRGKSVKSLTKKDFLLAQSILREKISTNSFESEDWSLVSILAAVLKLSHGIELFETQGVEGSFDYFYNFFRENGDKSKAAESLVRDIDFRSAFEIIGKLNKKEIVHPKISKLKDIVVKEILNNRAVKQIIFTQYRSSAEVIVRELSLLKEIKPTIFVGQTKKDDIGMSQKEQKRVLEEFRCGDFNVLVSTSVGEEGLDIPKVDQVIFYEPIPSAIRTIQRVGRTGRFNKGKVIMLITRGTRDEIFSYVSQAKEKRMYKVLDKIKDDLNSNQDKKVSLTSGKNSLLGFIEKSKRPKKENIKDKSTEKDTENLNKRYLLVDSRENSNLIKEFYKFDNLEVKVQNLEVGDILISDKICIERKSVKDFINSILDKRIFHQLFELVRNYQRPILIIEGLENIYSIRNLNPNVILSVLGTIAVKLRIPIIYTKSIEETANFVRLLYEKEFSNDNSYLSVLSKKSTSFSEELIQFISSIPSINVINAQKLLKEFRSVESLVKASKKELRSVEGIGSKRAETIFSFFRKEYQD